MGVIYLNLALASGLVGRSVEGLEDMLTNVVTPKHTVVAVPQYGKSFLVHPGTRLLVRSSSRSSFGGYIYTVALPAHDPVLGEYITPLSTSFKLSGDVLDVVEDNWNIT